MKGKFLVIAIILSTTIGTARSQNKFDTPATEAIVNKMTEAHGGLALWKASGSVRFKTSLKAVTGMFPDYEEMVIVDPVSRSAYLEFPGSTGKIAFDGKEAWSDGQRRGLAAAPPRFTAWRNFYLLNIPFVIHDEGVYISDLSEGAIPGIDKVLKTVKVTFGQQTGDTPKDYYVLYIDGDSHLLKGLEYNMTFASMLPQGRESLPTSTLTFEKYSTIEDFKMPLHYKVFFKEGHQFIIEGKVSEWNFGKPFDKSLMRKSETAQLDESQPRKSN